MDSRLRPSQKTLLVLSPVVVMVLIYLFPTLTHVFDRTRGLIIAFVLYWVGICFVMGLVFTRPVRFGKLYARPAGFGTADYIVLLLLTCLPVLLVFMISFLPNMTGATPKLLALAALLALINGTLEELFWRGAFISQFLHSFRFAVLYPLVLFTAWHISLGLIKGASFHGGIFALLAGAAIMGLLWGWLTWKTKSIYLSTLSHIGVNFFAFTEVLHSNFSF